MNEKIFARLNKVLTVVVMSLGAYIALMPYYPELKIWIDRSFDQSDGYVYRSELASEVQVPEEVLVEPPEGKRLVIPSIQVDEEILVGENKVLMDMGLWNRPNTTTPDMGGNSVIVGHRFAYGEDTPFYHLDKVEPGQRIGVWWDGTEYIYEVKEVIIVEPTALEIEGISDQNILTLYTCTPIWTASQRLVVRALLINAEDVGL